jgi:hypothetical protein
MEKPDYGAISRSINLNTGISWLVEDSLDDFFPDVIHFRDIEARAEEYLNQRKHKMFQYDALPCIMDYVPKKNGMLREALWLHPSHRILYLSLLHHFISKLDPQIPKSVYSYRLDIDPDDNAYPFPRRSDRWKDFINDFRQGCMDASTGTVLVTDLASYFDHISIDRLAEKIQTTLGRAAEGDTKHVLLLLKNLLHSWSTTGFGIPQNLDGSSFFGSFYLNDIDQQLVSKRYRSYRWLDDIRILTQNRKQALRALHDLQELLSKDRLFLASDKTKIIERGSPEFDALLDVRDDKLISEIEESIAAADCGRMKDQADVLQQRLIFHSQKNGDDRKFRAIANRLLTVSSFSGLDSKIMPMVRDLVLPRLDTHPDRSDYWSKMLEPCWHAGAQEKVTSLLVGPGISVFAWQRFYLWRLLTAANGPMSPDLINAAFEVGKSSPSDLVSSQAIVFIGRHGSNLQRKALFDDIYRANTPYPIQRAIIIALQELPGDARNRIWGQALKINPEHTQLVAYLTDLPKADYGLRPARIRKCRAEPKVITVNAEIGVGMIDGQRVRFRLARSHYDYE